MSKQKYNIINKMCNEHNEKHPSNGILTVRKDICDDYYIGLGAVPILQGISEDEAFWSIAAINNYADAQ